MPVNECLVPSREETKYLTPQISGVQTLFAKLTGLVFEVEFDYFDARINEDFGVLLERLI